MGYSQVEIREGSLEDEDEEESPEISKLEALVWLFIFTIWISFLSEYLVNAIEVKINFAPFFQCSPR